MSLLFYFIAPIEQEGEKERIPCSNDDDGDDDKNDRNEYLPPPRYRRTLRYRKRKKYSKSRLYFFVRRSDFRRCASALRARARALGKKVVILPAPHAIGLVPPPLPPPPSLSRYRPAPPCSKEEEIKARRRGAPWNFSRYRKTLWIPYWKGGCGLADTG